MADVFRIPSFHSLCFSSSLLTSLNSLQPALPPSQNCKNSEKRIYPLVYSSAGGASRFTHTPRKQLLSFKVPTLALDWAISFCKSLSGNYKDPFVLRGQYLIFFYFPVCCERIMGYPYPEIVWLCFIHI